MRFSIPMLCGLSVFGSQSVIATATEPIAPSLVADHPIAFSTDIQPILATHCYKCHGASRAEAGLRLDRRKSAFAGGDSGALIVPKKSAESLLVRRISATDEAERMPPSKDELPLNPAEIARIRTWIDTGAVWPEVADDKGASSELWSFKKPMRPSVPKVADSAIEIRNPIDAFIVDRLRNEGLVMSPAADRHTLIRRLSLDLIGLPPTLDDVDAFVLNGSSNAYLKSVDRLLGSSRFGERWARMWLDLARYADSTGYGADHLRKNIWPYRDWVIEAFNSNVPFDQFTIQQIAGDLLPKNTQYQLLATTFHRNTMTNAEGGIDNEEYRVAAVKDRTNTTMQVWMGLTFGCAQCHSHKYDPITQREYYQVYAYFDQTEDHNQHPREVPLARILPPSRRLESVELRTRIGELLRQLFARKTQATDTVSHSFRTTAPWTEIMRQVRSAAAKVTYAMHAPELKEVRSEIFQLTKKLASLGCVEVPILRDLPVEKRRTTHLLKKGNFLNHGELVKPGVPAALHPLPVGRPADRLAFAQWLVDRNNPLTARVMVNRIWSQLFGVGIVETEEDFGVKGSPPSHPELLDWLAVEFMESGWNMKHVIRLIVTSATYRQASHLRPKLLEVDTQNRLVARAPRYRLEAEMVRDQALAVSGLLSDKIGGPSVFPRQPSGLWKVAFQSDAWPMSEDDDRYRRGLYTFWRRTVPYPSMSTFDAPSRETCTMRRLRTNTPLQALVTLNDPVFVEAAQALARRVVEQGGHSPVHRARFVLRLCLCRPPRDDQVSIVTDLLDAELRHYALNADSAIKMATDPLGPVPNGMNVTELAAWTVVSSVLLNHDSVLTRN